MSAPDSGLPNAPGQGSLSHLISEQEQQILNLLEVMADVDIPDVARKTAEYFEQGNYPATVLSGLRIYGLDIDGLDEAINADDLEDVDLDAEFPDIFEEVDEQSGRQMAVIFNRLVDGLLSNVFETILTERPEGSQNIAFAGYLCELRDAVQDLEQRRLAETDDMDELVHVLSRTLGLVAHYFILYSGDDAELTEQLIANTYRSMYLGAELDIGEPTLSHPDETSSDAMATAVLLKGAIAMYEATDISVSRGAELAGIREAQFARELAAREIPVRYGPTDAADLRSGPDL